MIWRPEEENEIKKAFNSKASHRLSEMFRDAQNENKRPYWIEDCVWNDLRASTEDGDGVDVGTGDGPRALT